MARRTAHLAAGVSLVVVVVVSLAPTRSSPWAARKESRSFVPWWASTGFIAYRCRDQLCLMRPDGSGKRRLLSVGPSPQWDPGVLARWADARLSRLLRARGWRICALRRRHEWM